MALPVGTGSYKSTHILIGVCFYRILSFKSLRSELTDLHRVECTMSIKLQGRVWIYTFRVILTTSGWSRKLRINTGRPHSGLIGLSPKTGSYGIHNPHRLQVEFRGAGNVFLWGEGSL